MVVHHHNQTILHTLKSTCWGIRTPGLGPLGYLGDINGCNEELNIRIIYKVMNMIENIKLSVGGEIEKEEQLNG